MESNVHHSTAAPTETAEEVEYILRLEGICKRFPDIAAVEYLDLAIREGELLTLLGPSGCGKTTTLRLIAGLERPDEGRIILADRVVAGPDTFDEPEYRDIGIVFQDFALFPHMTAAENIGFGLSEMSASERSKKVSEMLSLVGLSESGEKRPCDLSGGQCQRIALARSLAIEPDILLLDEPFSNLDVDLRVRMREDVRRILKESGVTAISVTHDQEEALSISDRVAVMWDGRIEQVGTPEVVFQHPSSRFVAGFLGHASFLSAYVSGDIVETGIGRIGRDQIHGLAPEYDRTEIDVMVRPDDVLASPVEKGYSGNGVVTYRRYLGPTVMYRIELDNGDIVECMHNHTDQLRLDERVRVELPATHELAWFPTSGDRHIDSAE